MSEYKCPYCDKPIYDEEMLNCLYCGENLQRDTGFLSKMRRPQPKIIGLVIIIFVVISFLLFFLK